MCQEISAKMLERLRSPVCKPNGLAWPNFQTLAKTMDCSGMWDYFNDCLRKWPDVDADWKSRGGSHSVTSGKRWKPCIGSIRRRAVGMTTPAAAIRTARLHVDSDAGLPPPGGEGGSLDPAAQRRPQVGSLPGAGVG